MKKIKTYIALVVLLSGIIYSSCKEDTIKPTVECDLPGNDSSMYHPKKEIYQKLIDDYTKKGLPGIVLLIEDEDGIWMGASGKADIEKGVDMTVCTVSKVASITKMMVATSVLMLVEDGVLELDAKIETWLPKSIIDRIENAEDITLRQLMNHTSGIYDVITDQGFYLKLLNNPNRNWKPEEILEFAYNKEPYFEPGEGVYYSNTNYLLISMIVKEATGRGHNEILHEKIIDPLGMSNTYYHWHDDLPPTVAQGYYDLYNNGKIMNLSNYHTGSGNGYGGVYSTVSDLRLFIRALLIEKTLLSESMLAQMMTFTEVEPETTRALGLGIYDDYQDRPANEHAYGHRGRDLQYSADLFYFPDQNTTYAFLVNYGTNGSSALADIFFEFRDALADEICK